MINSLNSKFECILMAPSFGWFRPTCRRPQSPWKIAHWYLNKLIERGERLEEGIDIVIRKINNDLETRFTIVKSKWNNKWTLKKRE
ncbi:MAG: hypothetical protein AABY32_01645 [Nanoarchaeota archaeon]